MFWVFSGLLLVLALREKAKTGPREGAWLVWWMALACCPAWMTFRFNSILFDLRTIGAIIAFALIGSAVAEERRSRASSAGFRLRLTDLAIAVLVLSQIYTQFRIGRLGPLTSVEIARKWLLPYMVGRMFLTSWNDVGRIIPIVSKVIVGASLYAIIEAFTKVNIVNKILGKTFWVLEAGEGYRWGLKRAQGMLDHPIFFGVFLVLIFPWVIEAAMRAKEKLGPKWWFWVPVLHGTAVVVTVSRGAQVSLVIATGVLIFLRKPRWRPPMIAAAILAGGVGAANKDTIDHVLSKWAGEKAEDVRIIDLYGEDVEYTGTLHRKLLYRVYADALVNSGYFGYGSELLGIDLPEHLALRFGSIDNHYMLFYLQYGYMGLYSFIALVAGSLWNYGRVAWNVDRDGSRLCGAFVGCFGSVCFSMTTVWFSFDYAVSWLFCAGLSANLGTLAATFRSTTPFEIEGPRDAAEPPEPKHRPRLVPGHAPIRTNVADGP